MLRVRACELDATLAHPFIDEDLGLAETPLLVVDVDDPSWVASDDAAAALRALAAVCVAVYPASHGASQSPLGTSAFDLVLGSVLGSPGAPEPEELNEIATKIRASPQAAVVLAQLLRMTEHLSVRDALIAESLAYSTLQSSPTFRRWLQDSDYNQDSEHTVEVAHSGAPPVLVESTSDELVLTFNRPERHNAFSADMRDQFVEALRTAVVAGTESIRVRGNGPTFCSGGDLAEFGTTPDSSTAHTIRSVRSAPWWVHLARHRTTFELHGSCFGAGIELAAFSDRVIARTGTTVSLPEIRFGLIPGAGGTVSIPRRIGRHRTLWLALTGASLDTRTALAWGLVDEVTPNSSAESC